MRKVLWAGIATLCGSVIGACSGSTDNTAPPGAENGSCLSNGACNAGLVCASHTCVRLPGGPGDASGVGGSGNAPGSGGSGGSGGQGTGARTSATDGGGTANGGASGGQGGQATTTGGSGNDGSVDSGSCTSDAAAGMALDLLLLLDESGSMSQGTRWQDVSSALITFLNDPTNAGIDVAVEYFPFKVPGAPFSCCIDSDCGTFGPCVPSDFPPIGGCSHPFSTCAQADSCNATSYAPAVPFALPVDHAPVVASLQGQTPGGGTPTRPALEAAMQYVETWTASHASRRAAIIMITDGDPTACTTNTVQDVANVTAAGLKGGVETFVIGIGSSLRNLDLVAVSGGTGQAYFADAGDSGGLVSDALAKVRAAALASGCVPRKAP